MKRRILVLPVLVFLITVSILLSCGAATVSGGGSGGGDIIPFFHWPPASQRITLSDLEEFVIQPGTAHTLSEVNILLRNALLSCDYEYKYYATPNGFALITKLEQYNLDGYTLEEKRWELEPSYNGFDLANIFRPPEGYYRIIAFAVTDALDPDSAYRVSRDEAEAWLKDGCLALPESIGEIEFSSRHYCVALIYEFEQIGTGDRPEWTFTCVNARTHLDKSGLLDMLMLR